MESVAVALSVRESLEVAALLTVDDTCSGNELQCLRGQQKLADVMKDSKALGRATWNLREAALLGG